MSATLTISDLSRQKRLDTELGDELSFEHDVDQAIDHFLQERRIPRNGLRWTAVSRGRRLDGKTRLGELPTVDHDWRVLPEAVAG